MATLNHVLSERQHRISSGERRRSWAVSAIGHGLLSGLFFVLPALLAEPQEPFDFVAVTVVPPRALGSADAPPPGPSPPPEPQPQPAPPPPPTLEPEPEKQPVADDRPILVEKKTQEKKRREPPPQAPPPSPAPRQATPSGQVSSGAPAVAGLPRRRGSPFGDPLGASTNEATLGVEDPNFTYGYYLDLVVSRISGNWTRPLVGGEARNAVLFFRIEKDGSVQDLALRQSSGEDTFDQAALRAVEASSPLPPLPKGYKRDFLGINLIVK